MRRIAMHGPATYSVLSRTRERRSRTVRGAARHYTDLGGNMESEMNNGMGSNASKIWIGIAVGAAVGIGIALSRRKKSHWDSAREVTRRISDRSGDLADATRDIVDRVKTIYE